MFAFITMIRAGPALTTYRTIVELIANTTTKKGLKINADLGEGPYPTGVKITNAQLAAVCATGDDFHGDWTTPSTPARSPNSWRALTPPQQVPQMVVSLTVLHFRYVEAVP